MDSKRLKRRRVGREPGGSPTRKAGPGMAGVSVAWAQNHHSHFVCWYRLLGGRFVGRTLLLTTVGRRSGQPRTVVVGYLRYGDDVIVTGSNFAKPAVPAWVLNLRVHPEAEVRLGRERYQARVEFLKGEDRAGQWDRLVAADPTYDQVQRLAGREIPVIRLRRFKGSSE